MNNLYESFLDAYDKLKSYIYYDNFSLNLRIKLSKYEENLENNIKNLTIAVELYSKGLTNNYLSELLESIYFNIMPKKFKNDNESNQSDIFYVSNVNEKNEYKLDSVTYFIDCPVDIHLISFLWILKIGIDIDSKLSKNCFANRIINNIKNDNTWRKRIFFRYFEKYQEWRDKAIEVARKLHDVDNDIAIISMDIKNYYDTVNFDFSNIEPKFNGYDFLNDLLEKIHITYKNKRNIKNNILPIGLISSGILANHYLIPLDNLIENKLCPKYYGRYVDDILLVIDSPKFKDGPDEFINNLLVKSDIINEENNDYYIILNGLKLYIQKNKFRIYHFLSNEPITILNEFKKSIKRNSSEFRLFPEEDNILNDFTTKSFNINYSDTINKIRSIEGIDTNKYGASKHLARILFILKYTNNFDKKLIKIINSQIYEFFSGQRNIEFNGLWEKVFTIFTINKESDEIITFLEYTLEIIIKIKHDEGSRIKQSLISHLINSLSMAVSLDYPFFTEFIFNEVKRKLSKKDYLEMLPVLSTEEVKNKSQSLINSNLFRHSFCFYPLLNICKQKETFSFRNKILNDETKFNLHNSKIKFFPRYIQYHELCLFFHIKSLHMGGKLPTTKYIYEKYLSLNKLNKNNHLGLYPKTKTLDNITHVSIPEHHKRRVYKNSTFKVSVVNISVDFKNSLYNFLNKPNLSFERIIDINHALNLSLKERAEVIVFPEISIPIQWVGHIAEFSKKNNIAIICGIEHVSNKKNEVFNYSATILPFESKRFRNVFIDLRIKKDYSPEETRQIENRFYKIPDGASEENLRIYSWRNLLFTVFNCFELSDINKRSAFKGKVDFAIAIEHNKDLLYFSNIIESVARDIHSYIIQVNSSNYGDSRITQPAIYYMKDIVRIKGGENTTIITGNLNINELREFQKLKFELQKDHPYFKPTPPGFNLPNNRS